MVVFVFISIINFIMNTQTPDQYFTNTLESTPQIHGPFQLEYGKIMMWFLLITDLFTFGTLLISLVGFRFNATDWPVAEKVFSSFPFTEKPFPLLFVGTMTFILIISSLTMAMAVDHGFRMDKNKVIRYLIFTIAGGIVFLGSQAWEWSHMIHQGARLTSNPWGTSSFSAFFFLITGFHGLHVFSGIVLLVILLINVSRGVYDVRGHYLMVEKIGLYWHFVDVVWVFVFTFFYLI